MPNGGTDNCMNCPHNRANKAPANVKTALTQTRVPFCTVHQIPVWDRAWTYCPNFAKKDPSTDRPIYTNGLHESGYARIPWLGLTMPTRNIPVKRCEVCGDAADSGIHIDIPALGTRAEFCCNDHYEHWWREQRSDEKAFKRWYFYDRSMLQQAILGGDEAQVAQRLEQRGTINHQDMSGWTALHLAAFHGMESSVDLLLNAGADATLEDIVGLKPIDLAGREGHTEVVDRLVATSFGDQQGKEDALLSAATAGNLEVVEALVKDGVDIECRDYRGRTPLLLAIWENHYTTSVFLLDHGADVRVQDKFGETPLSTVDTWNNQLFTELKRLVHEWLAR